MKNETKKEREERAHRICESGMNQHPALKAIFEKYARKEIIYPNRDEEHDEVMEQLAQEVTEAGYDMNVYSVHEVKKAGTLVIGSGTFPPESGKTPITAECKKARSGKMRLTGNFAPPN